MSTSNATMPRTVLSHWHKLFEGLQFSSKEFYAAVESAIAERQVPKLEQSRVDFKEGGLLSANREYLCLQRERLLFDICAAPFGTGFFVSWRLAEVPLPLKLWHFLVVFLGLCFVWGLFMRVFGGWWGSLLFFTLAALGVWHLRTAVSRGLEDVDATLMKTPILGPIYERFLRPMTYYRIDLAIMYQDTVHHSVLQAVDAMTSAKGVKPLTELERTPTLEKLYGRR